MSEAEFDRLLDAVRDAMAPELGSDLGPDLGSDFGEDRMIARLRHLLPFRSPRKPANDNGRAWPLIPFPEGWYAAC